MYPVGVASIRLVNATLAQAIFLLATNGEKDIIDSNSSRFESLLLLTLMEQSVTFFWWQVQRRAGLGPSCHYHCCFSSCKTPQTSCQTLHSQKKYFEIGLMKQRQHCSLSLPPQGYLYPIKAVIITTSLQIQHQIRLLFICAHTFFSSLPFKGCSRNGKSVPEELLTCNYITVVQTYCKPGFKAL